MNEQYLWDKTTEPDDETRELESLLSEFRYQPRPLVLPVTPPKRFFVFDYRIAAIAAMVLLAMGSLLWVSFGKKGKDEVASKEQPAPTIAIPQPSAPDQNAGKEVKELARKIPDEVHQIPVRRMPKVLRPLQISHRRSGPSLATQERQAKDKLMFALQVTSDKLDLIQKKVSVDSN